MIMYRELEICLEDFWVGFCGIFEVVLVCGRVESVGNECWFICEDLNVLVMVIVEFIVSEMYCERSVYIKIFGIMMMKLLFLVNFVYWNLGYLLFLKLFCKLLVVLWIYV